MRTIPPASSARRWKRQPSRRPSNPPSTDRQKATAPMTPAAVRMSTSMHVRETPTARASMLVATARAVSRPGVRAAGSGRAWVPQP